MPSLLDIDPYQDTGTSTAGGLLGLGDAPRITPPDDRSVDMGQAYQTLMDAMHRQQQISAQRGLWDDATGMPTAAGIVNAAGQYGNALMMGTTAPGGTSPEIASMDPIEHMLAQIKADPKSKWGLRITEDPIEGGPGTVLPPSRIWDDGEPTDKTLEGTSTIGIAGANRSSVEQALARGGINSDTPWNYYPGEHVHLVKGDTAKQGYDNDERIIPDAQLVASYRKQNAGPSPLLPMTPVAP